MEHLNRLTLRFYWVDLCRGKQVAVCPQMLSKLLATAAQGSSGAKSSRSGDFAMVSEGYDSLDGPWNLSNAVQVSELKNLIWTRVIFGNEWKTPSPPSSTPISFLLCWLRGDDFCAP